MMETPSAAAPEETHAARAGAQADPPPAVQLTGVKKAFGDFRVLDGLDLTLAKGEVFSVVGPSGCGKSVTLKIIMGLLRPDAGSVKVDGREITGYSEAQLAEVRRSMGMVFQFGALFDSLTVEENVAFGLERHTTLSYDERRQVVVEKLDLVGLRNILDKLPSELSGGMRKRVSLARAIAMEPEILMWDEPTTGLDPVMTSEIDRLIDEMGTRLGVTSLVVTHDMRSAFRVSDRVGVHHGGRLVEVGTPDEIKASEEPFVHQFINGLLEGPMQVRVG